MFYSYFYKISFRILKNHRFYKKTGASWFYYHSHSCTTFNLCISSACLRPNLMPLLQNEGSFFVFPLRGDSLPWTDNYLTSWIFPLLSARITLTFSLFFTTLGISLHCLRYTEESLNATL